MRLTLAGAPPPGAFNTAITAHGWSVDAMPEACVASVTLAPRSATRTSADTTGKANHDVRVEWSHAIGDSGLGRSITKLVSSGNPMTPAGNRITSLSSSSIVPN